MRVKMVCNGCGGAGCDTCDERGYAWRFERDPEVVCQGCMESFRDGSEEAEFIGWHGVCSKCVISDEMWRLVMIDFGKIERWCEAEYLSTNVVKELITRLRQAEKDAERYRWLEEQNKSVMSKVMVCNGWIDDGEDVDYVDDITHFIDEAMNASNN